MFNDTEPGAEEAAEAAKAKGNNKYRRDKPWDHDGIDHWCVATDPTSTTQALRADHLLSPHIVRKEDPLGRHRRAEPRSERTAARETLHLS